MNKLLKLLIVFLIIITVFSLTTCAAPYQSYNYINGNNGIIDVSAPCAYKPVKTFDESNLSVNIASLEDVCQDSEGNFYILDSTLGYIYSFTSDWEKRYSIFGYLEKGNQNPTALEGAQGISIWNNILFVADTNKNQIVKFDINTKALIGFIKAPESDLFSEGFEFRPKKISVDNTGRIFVVAENVNEGLMELTQDGDFVGYVGSNTVVASPFEIIFRHFLTKKQIEGRISFVPVEYTNISLDSSGFIYAVTAVSDVGNPIRKLNPSGDDILVRNPVNGVGKVSGDLLYEKDDSVTGGGPSSFVDIAVNQQGIYFALDKNKGRIFAYDEDGNLLFEFGGNNTYQEGTFLLPSAISIVGDTIYVLDHDRKVIIQFEPTEYGKAIINATRSYVKGNYDESLQEWNQILKRNSNFDLAYVKSGFCLYRLEKYEQAMNNFKLANARNYYTKAFVKYRTKWLNEHFTIVFIGLIAVITVIVAASILLRKAIKKHKKKCKSIQKEVLLGG